MALKNLKDLKEDARVPKETETEEDPQFIFLLVC